MSWWNKGVAHGQNGGQTAKPHEMPAGSNRDQYNAGVKEGQAQRNGQK